MADAEKKEPKFENNLLTSVLLLVIAGTLIMIASETLELLSLVEKCKDGRCHKHHDHHRDEKEVKTEGEK